MNTPSILQRVRRGCWMLVAVPVMVLWGMAMTGCPQDMYDAGFADGFAEDSWYDEGYDDSWSAVEDENLYEGDEIPNPDSPAYDAGYWDGVWYAYNDGYFDAYYSAFLYGFEDGYTAANFEGWEEFLLTDQHIEYGTGGYDDGYNDGFSEGEVFGAYDYWQMIPSDWEDALEDYSGTETEPPIDVCVPVGTGEICTGEIPLYEYPEDRLKSGQKCLDRVDKRAVRQSAEGSAAVKGRRDGK